MSFSPFNLSAAFFGSTTFQLLLIFFHHLSLKSILLLHMSDFTNFILSSFQILLSFKIVSSSMMAFLALPILALTSSEQLPVLVLMAPRYLKVFTLAVVSTSTSIDTFAFSSPTTISFFSRAFNLVVLSSEHHLPFVLCWLFPVEIFSLAYINKKINLFCLMQCCRPGRAQEVRPSSRLSRTSSVAAPSTPRHHPSSHGRRNAANYWNNA